MAERSISFSAEMVRAILDGRKTVTRRPVKGMPEMPEPECHPLHQRIRPLPYFDAYCGAPKTQANPRGMTKYWCWWQVDDRQCMPMIECPCGAPGDRLMVRGSEIALDVVSVSCEWLSNLTEAEAMAEGAPPILVPPDGGSCPHIEGFQQLWDGIYGPGSWDANPLVWRVEFRRAE